MTDSVISRRMPGGSLEPVSAEERILTLDVLRGLALLGVIISNMRWFSGLVFRFPAYRQYLQEFSLDSLAYHAVGIFVTGKAIATLSFLFGLGFYVQLFRAEQRGGPFVSVYCRRLAVLLMLGLVHMVLLWYGDILTVYAVFGFVLLWAARRSDRAVVIMAGLLIIGLPIALGVTTTVMNFSDASPELALGSRGRAEANAATLAVFQERHVCADHPRESRPSPPVLSRACRDSRICSTLVCFCSGSTSVAVACSSVWLNMQRPCGASPCGVWR